MKKICILFLVLILAFCLLPSSVSAQGESSEGAVKINLVEVVVINPGNPPLQPPVLENGDVVGSVVLNTTLDGKLRVNVNVDTEPNLENYDIILNVNYGPPPWTFPPTPGTYANQIFPDVLNTNDQGQGNVKVQLDIDPPPFNEVVWVGITILEEVATPPAPQALPEYRLEEPAVVPLKPANPKGAVKVNIVEVVVINPGNPPLQPPVLENGDVVGSVIINVDENGKLTANVNLDTEPNLEDYDIILNVNYGPPPWTFPPIPGTYANQIFPDVLNTNDQGQGNVKVQLDIDPPPSNEVVWVGITILEEVATPPAPQALPEYRLEEPSTVPLK